MNNPPKSILKFFRWYCHPDLVVPVEGDLMELYEERVNEKGKRKADWLFIRDVLLLLRKDIIRPASGSQKLNYYGMIKHYIKLSLRSFGRFKTSFIINLVGLSSGLASVFLIYLWIYDELSIDKFHTDGDRIYQVMQNINNPDEIWTMTNTQALLANALSEEIPEVEMATAFIPTGSYGGDRIIGFNGKKLKVRDQYANENFFEFFSFPLKSGQPSEVLTSKNQVVLSEGYAQKLFGSNSEPIGQVVTIYEGQEQKPFVVSGIFEELPKNSTQQFDLIFSMEAFLNAHPHIRDWENSDPSTFIKVKEHANLNVLAEKLEHFVSTKREGYKHTHFLQKYSERYLYGKYEDGEVAGGRISYVKLFSLIAALVLIIACINFMNLATARASRRLKEIGVKKAMGAGRSSLAAQYFVEAALMTSISIVAAFAFVMALLPFFNELTGKSLSVSISWELVRSVALIGLVTSLLAGSYPAIYLSKFNPVHIFRGKASGSKNEMFARRVLVVFQFSISILLVSSIMIISSQVNFIMNKNLGFSKEQVIYFNADGDLERNTTLFIEELKKESSVVNASEFRHDLLGGMGTTSGMRWEGKAPDAFVQFGNLEVGFDLIETFDLQLAAGRSFSKELGDDNSKILLNEKAIEVMGLKDPIGKTVELWNRNREVIGVVKNFHFESLHKEIRPCFFQLNEGLSSIVVRLQPGQELASIEKVELLYKAYNPGLPFEFKFFDQEYEALYRSEQQVSSLSRLFGVVAIIVSCLGLLGLVTFTAERRRKEIGIRKVLGSDELQLVWILSSDFSKMVLLSVAISLPAGYYIMERWLASFAYHVALDIWTFLFAGIASLIVAWATMSSQTFKIARLNPIESLKDE